MAWVLEHSYLILLCAGLFGFLMAWGVGANDVANAMGTSVGAKALTVKQAVLVAIIFEFAGAWLAGGEVTNTVRKGLVEPAVFAGQGDLLIYGMMAALLAAGIWLAVASSYGWPVSTTHSIVGAIVGFAAVGVGVDAVNWSKVGQVVASWVVSPLLAGTIAFLLVRSVNHLILDTADPFTRAKRYVPVYMFLTGFAIAMVTFVKGLKHVGLELGFGESLLYSMGAGILVAGIGAMILAPMQPDPEADREFRFTSVERIFAVLMIFTACAMAFAHGSNDVANAVGPLAAIYSVIHNEGDVAGEAAVPQWVLLLGASGIVAGLAMFGTRVMATVGQRITFLTPSRGFAAELAAATTVVLASGTGLPVSTTQVLVGAVLGVGLARGIAALNLRTVGTVFASWVVTLPAGGVLAIIFFYIFKAIFGG